MSSSCIFFVVDFYRMRETSDANDTVPETIQFIYPTEQRENTEFINRCGELIAFTHYFQKELLFSTPVTWTHDKTTLIHRTYGRHSMFLSVPTASWPIEKLKRQFETIINVFHLLYGSWNQILSVHSNDTPDQMFDFLSKALTPILDPILQEHQNFARLFTIVDYISLKKGNQHIVLESEHLLDYVQSKYPIKYSILGYDSQVLLSNWTGEKTFYLDFIFKIRKELNDDLIEYRCETPIQLRTGVSLFRIFLPEISFPPASKTNLKNENFSPLSNSCSPRQFHSIFSSQSESESSNETRRSIFNDSSLTSSLRRLNRQALILPRNESASSEDFQFDTDSSPTNVLNENPTLTPYAPINNTLLPLADFESQRSRRSTYSELDERIETLTRSTTNSPIVFRPVHSQYETDDDDEDEDDDDKPFEHRTTTLNGDEDPLISLPAELRLSWKNIPEKNIEEERKEYVLYVQRNSRSIFAGILDPTMIKNDLLNNLFNLLLDAMAQIERVLQSKCLTKGTEKKFNEVKFQFNDETNSIQLERTQEGNQTVVKTPDYEATSLAMTAQSKLRENAERQYVIISRANQSVMGEYHMKDRIFYTCSTRSTSNGK